MQKGTEATPLDRAREAVARGAWQEAYDLDRKSVV